MNNGPVESCVVQAVRRWEFPRPAGGGIAIVVTPFNFAPYGDATTGSNRAIERTPAHTAPGPFSGALRARRGKDEFRRWGNGPDVERLTELARRK